MPGAAIKRMVAAIHTTSEPDEGGAEPETVARQSPDEGGSAVVGAQKARDTRPRFWGLSGSSNGPAEEDVETARAPLPGHQGLGDHEKT